MGIHDFQRATTLLLRQAPLFQGEALETLLGSLDLTSAEESNLRFLAADRLAQKFAYNMSTIRRRMALNGMPLTRVFLADELNKALWYEHFEPVAARIRTYHLAYRYICFLRDDPVARDLLQRECPAFIIDVLAYEAAQAFLRCYEMPAVPSLPKESHLTTQRLQIVQLAYDIPALAGATLGAKAKPDPSRLVVQQRKMYMLFTSAAPSARLSQFEIDRETAEFLLAESRGQVVAMLPKSFPDLVAARLCKTVVSQFG